MSDTKEIVSFVLDKLKNMINESMPEAVLQYIARSSAVLNNQKTKRRRKPKKMYQWRDSWIFKLTTTGRSEIQNHFCDNQNARLFRKRYRMNYPTFEKLIQKLRNSPMFAPLLYSSQQSTSVPFELKVLATLRYIGRGQIVDDSSEISGISAEVLRVFVTVFCELMVVAFYKSDIGDLLKSPSASHFSYKALPGCLGCIDSTHVMWGNCPAKERNMFSGKHGRPTLAFSIVVDHNLRIISCSRGHPGIMNDKTIVRYEPLVKRLLTEPALVNYPYKLLSANLNGNIEEIAACGAYLLCDGGYLQSSVLMNPIPHPENSAEAMFSNVTSGLRKDVERVFGILKHRFRLLKNDILCRDREHVSNIFITACILHNFLLEHQDDCSSEDISIEGIDIAEQRSDTGSTPTSYESRSQIESADLNNDDLRRMGCFESVTSNSDDEPLQVDSLSANEPFASKELEDKKGFWIQRTKLVQHLSAYRLLRLSSNPCNDGALEPPADS